MGSTNTRARTDQEKIKIITALLVETLPNVSEDRAQFYASTFVELPEEAEHLYHHGKKDRDQIAKLSKSLTKAREALDCLSLWASQALENSAHKRNIWGLRSKPNTSWNLEEFTETIELWIAAAEDADELLRSGRPSHGKNFRAIVVIDGVAAIWSQAFKKEMPQEIGVDGKMAAFLVKVFDVLGVGAEVIHAYENWYLYASDPKTPLDLPRKTW